jgi:hypothetical protein
MNNFDFYKYLEEMRNQTETKVDDYVNDVFDNIEAGFNATHANNCSYGWFWSVQET